MRTILLSILFSIPLFSLQSNAQTFVGTFVMTKGDVKVLRSPSANQKGPFLVYEGKKFSYEKARIGRKVKGNELVQTGTDGRAKVVYPNGDNFNLGPGTSMSMPSGNEAAKGKKTGSKLNLFYGRVRSLITKGGPRTNLKVKTPSATAGVRGTDFFLRHNPTEGSQVSVLRGEVSMQDTKKGAISSKPIKVKKGFTAKVENKVTKKSKAVKAELATKEEIVEIQKETALKPSQKAMDKLSEKVKKEVQKLNVKSTEAVVADIKKDDPKLYEQIKDKIDMNNIDEVYEINTKVVAKLYEQAPGEVKKKPSAEELEAIGKDVYNKYFRSVE